MVVYSKIAMDNQEEILDALNNFEKKKGEIPPVLEQYLKNIAKTGETLFPWPRVKPLFVGKLEDVMSKFHRELPADHLSPCPNVENPKFKEMRKRILDSVNKFSGAPFTIQRLCELLTDPKKHYRRTDKFLRGIEKNILVVSTVDPFGNKIVSESREVMVNGMEGSPVNGNGAESPTTTTDLTPVQYSGFPQQQTDWTTDSWAGVGTSQESGETTPAGQAEDKGSHQEESSQSPDRSPGEEGDKMEEGEPHQDLRDRESPEGEDASPAKKSKLTVSSEETPESSSSEVTTQESSKVIQEKADTSSPTENTESSPDNAIAESPEVTTQESSKVGQEPEAGSSKPESPGDDENSETSVEMEQKDLTENSLESSQVPSPRLEEEKCDKSLPQESVSSPDSRAADDNRDQKSVTAENSENSQEDSSSKIPEAESSPTQSDQSPKESAEESDANLPGESAGKSDANLPGEEEHMNVDNGGGSRKCEDDTENPADDPQNGVNDPQNSVNDPQTSADSTQTKETSPSEEEEEEGKKGEEEERGTPMEED